MTPLVFISLSLSIFLFLLPPVALAAETRIGTVDMAVLTALHPTMAQFDFQKRAFLKVPFDTPQAERVSLCHHFREEAKRQEPVLNQTMTRLAAESAFIESRRAEIIRAIPHAASPQERVSLERELRDLVADQRQIRSRQEETRSQLESPEYSTPSETRSLFATIEKEVFDTMEEVAAQEGIGVVLNANLPFPPTDPSTSRISPVLENRLTWLETDLYYAFLASSSPDSTIFDTLGPKAPMEEWLQLIRHPAAAPFFPVRPYPLVLRGGTDLTDKVLARLLEKYHVDSNREAIIVEAVHRFRTNQHAP